MLDNVPSRPCGGKRRAVAAHPGQWYTAAKSRGRDRAVAALYWWRLFTVTGSVAAYLMYKKLALH